MPNLAYLLTNFAYHAGLAAWTGGVIVLGAFVAPELFRGLPRAEAGALFGRILRRFLRLRVAALALTVLAAAIKLLAWERHAVTPSIGFRWLAIAGMAGLALYELFHLEGAIESARTRFDSLTPADDPSRAAFNVLHRRAERVMKAGLTCALVAMLLS